MSGSQIPTGSKRLHSHSLGHGSGLPLLAVLAAVDVSVGSPRSQYGLLALALTREHSRSLVVQVCMMITVCVLVYGSQQKHERDVVQDCRDPMFRCDGGRRY